MRNERGRSGREQNTQDEEREENYYKIMTFRSTDYISFEFDRVVIVLLHFI